MQSDEQSDPNSLQTFTKRDLGVVRDISMKTPSQCWAEVKKARWKVLPGKEHGKQTRNLFISLHKSLVWLHSVLCIVLVCISERLESRSSRKTEMIAHMEVHPRSTEIHVVGEVSLQPGKLKTKVCETW